MTSFRVVLLSSDYVSHPSHHVAPTISLQDSLPHTHSTLSLTLDLHPWLALVKRHKPLYLIHTLLGRRIVPRRILHLGLVRCNRVVARVALVRTVGFGRRGAKVRGLDGVGWELWGLDGACKESERGELT